MRSFLLAAVWSLALGCSEERVDECGAPADATGTCEQACATLFEIDCRVGQTAEECATVCVAATADLDEEVLGRALACYAAAKSCGEVDGCSRNCGPGEGPVPFGTLDAGTADADSGI